LRKTPAQNINFIENIQESISISFRIPCVFYWAFWQGSPNEFQRSCTFHFLFICFRSNKM